MTDKQAQDLTAAQMCRVYAASGMAVSFAPDKLLRIAEAMDASSKMLDQAIATKEKARKDLRNAFHWYIVSLVNFVAVLLLVVLA